MEMIVLNYKKSGEQFWNRLHLSPVHGDDGRILYFFGSQIDMTEYRRIEALEAGVRYKIRMRPFSLAGPERFARTI